MTKIKYKNRLAKESSPYLLQHAHNPVHWYPWGEEALEKARTENKLLLISIGYSACHWCHVMEHESFEDEEVAQIMNEHFVSIKVDREERPDVDQVYMNAVQLLTGQGGWPLNCFALPDGSPVYGGTYFPKKQWMQVLEHMAKVYRNEPEKATQQAQALKDGIARSESIPEKNPAKAFTHSDANAVFETFMAGCDPEDGGFGVAPKFPMPSNWLFLMRYYHHMGNDDALNHTLLSLDKMAQGGIYDHVGGGFARYATLNNWNVPHFEKMLYDNGQLLSVYSEAYQLTKNDTYKQVVYETVRFLERELLAPEGSFYSALDADSEGEEGKYYVWSLTELNELLGADAEFIGTYFNCLPEGNWEEGKNNLYVTNSIKALASLYKLSREEAYQKLERAKQKLLTHREQHIRPGLDDKILTSWNALAVKGLSSAYQAFSEARFLKLATMAADFILVNQLRSDGGLWRNYKQQKSSIHAFLDDYALTIDAFIGLYRSTFDEKWLLHADALTQYVLQHFIDRNSGMFFYTDEQYTDLVVRKQELADNVIPASNSVMAHNLYSLGIYQVKREYTEQALQMLSNVLEDTQQHARYYSHWASLLLREIFATKELAITGSDADARRRELETNYYPHLMVAGTTMPSDLPLLRNRFVEGKTLLYVCENSTCKLPVQKVVDAIKILEQ